MICIPRTEPSKFRPLKTGVEIWIRIVRQLSMGFDPLFSRLKHRLLFHLHRIHDPDNCRIDRKFLCSRCEPSTGTLNAQHHFAFASSDRIYDYE